MPVVVVPPVVVLSSASVNDMAGLQGVDAGAGGGDMQDTGTGIMFVTDDSTVELESGDDNGDDDDEVIMSGFIHGCDRICSSVGRSAGRYSKQRRIRSSHCGDRRRRPGVLVGKLTVARTI